MALKSHVLPDRSGPECSIHGEWISAALHELEIAKKYSILSRVQAKKR
jgi:hypothetical protein